MTAIIDNSRIIINGDYDVRGGCLGETVVLSAVTLNFSLVPGVGPINFTKYYNGYVVQTNVAINITLPTVEVTIGWYCRIDLVSTTGAGSIAISNGAINVATLNSNSTFGSVQTSVTLVKIAGTNSWATMYSVPIRGGSTQMPVITPNGMLMRSYISGRFFSFCDTVAGTVIDANTTTDVPLRWINATGQFIDSAYYSVVSSTRITFLVTGSYSFGGIIGISNAGLATQANIIIRPRLNGVTFLTSFSVVTGTIQAFTNGVYYFEGAFALTAGDYIEIMVGKTVLSAGTNPVVLGSTSMSVNLVGQN
jgi:hypothetical protein